MSGSAGAAEQIALEGVSKRYRTSSGAVLAVGGMSLEVRSREFVTLLGPGGCGKSTVLGMIGGLIQPDAGVLKRRLPLEAHYSTEFIPVKV
jgi:ABC-type Fe3+/spermidine/putrescine transport system ATPase subunit